MTVTIESAALAHAKRFRRNQWLGAVTLVGVLALAAWWWWNQRPQSWTLRISAGARLSRRQDFAEGLVRETRRSRIRLLNEYTEGSVETLLAIEQRRLDLGFVQGGVDLPEDSTIRQVAVLESELLHLFVKPGTSEASFSGLKGRSINVGQPGSGTRLLADEVLAFLGWVPGEDFQPLELSYDELLALPAEQRPDAVFGVAAANWSVGKRIVREWKYELMPLPFGEAIALGDSALDSGRIPIAAYQVEPPVPFRTLETIGTRLILVAREDVPAEPVAQLVEAIYEGDYARRVDLKQLDVSALTRFRQYPPHAGALQYLRRNDPVINSEWIESAENLRSFLVSLAIAGVLFWRWRQRRRLIGFEVYLDRATEIEAAAIEWERSGSTELESLRILRRKLSELKSDALERHAEGTLSGEEHLLAFLAHVSDVRAYLESLYADAGRKAAFSQVRAEPVPASVPLPASAPLVAPQSGPPTSTATES
jgi:TRAP transporter TAXI family solute receptor